MTLVGIQTNQTLLTLPFDVWAQIFSQLDPEDLVNFACASEKCHQFILRFNPLARLERVCGFAKEMVFRPWNEHFSKTYLCFRALKSQRLISDAEWEEIERLLPTFERDLPESNSRRPPVILLDPRPVELLRACPKKRFCFSHLVSPVQKTTAFKCEEVDLFGSEACPHYNKLAELVFSLFEKMGPQEFQPYVPAADKLKALVLNSSNEKRVLNSTIEEAVWSIILILKGKGIAAAEEDCKKLVQIELANMDPEVVMQMERILEITFETLKPLYAACKTIEINQRKNVRQPFLTQRAERDEANGNPGAEILRQVGLIPIIFYSAYLVHEVKILAYILPSNYHDSLTHVFLDIIGCVGLTVAAWKSSLFFPIRAEIRQNEQGEEEIRYTPHPLRARVRRCADIVLITGTALSALRYVSKFF